MTIKEISEWLVKVFDSTFREEVEDLTFFVPWDLERNMPRVTVDTASVYLDTLWIA